MYPTSDQAVAGKTCRERSAGQDQPRGAAESTVELAIRPPVPVTVFLSAWTAAMKGRALRRGRRAHRGQVMVLFSLMAVLLFVIAGLAVDAGMSYLSSDRAERAAASAALAGVAYLPGDYGSAQNAALVEAARNGFTSNCPGNPCVTTTQPVTNELKVTVSATVNTTFLRLVGFGAHTVTRSATAIYLPPIQIGQPGSQQGSAMVSPCDGVGSSGTYCTSPSSGLGSANNYFFMRVEGWGVARGEGDAFGPSPNDQQGNCGLSGTGNCVASPPDVHQISPWDGTENNDATLNYTGGFNYLIDVPPGQKADVQIYNPSFAPDSNDQNGGYSYHEDDGSFPDGSTSKTDYGAMAYTVYTAPTLSSRLSDTKISQEVFYPYNATGLYKQGGSGRSYYYFPVGSGSQTTVNNYTPATYHAWTSAIQYYPTNANDKNLYNHATDIGAGTYLDNTSGTVDKYWRLRVDGLNWDGSITCGSSTCSTPTTTSSSYSTAHKGYAVRVVAAPSATCTGCGVSAMDDATFFTPIHNTSSSPAQFSIPIFKLDAAYAGQIITIDLFDQGDVGGGAAYAGITYPKAGGGTAFASLAPGTNVTDVGNSLGSGGTATVASLGAWPVGGGTCGACYQTASSSGAELWNGHWAQLQVTVPSASSFDSAQYWNLVYGVAGGVTSDDTFSLQIGSNGSPDHLLP